MQAGSRVGHFEVRELIGRGGMGEVWRAHDTRLERDVALKTLPPQFAADARSIARIEREARLLATLNHPNIAAILGLEELGDLHLLVLELVEGETLEDRLASGKLALQDAIDISLQVAEALRAAHSHGIIHCDLKPANVKVSAEGRVKVLDFGIARSPQAPPPSQQTTLTSPPSTGEVAGTPAYMSPEQARGELVGPTADIWAFGVLLYRMLAGRLPFVGPTTADTFAQVLQTEPDLAVLRPQVPEPLIRLLRRCLEKDPRRRVQHAGDLHILIEEAMVPAAPGDGARPHPLRKLRLAIVGLTALAGLSLFLWMRSIRGGDHELQGPVHAELSFAAGTSEGRPFGNRRIAIARDGSRIAVSTSNTLWLRSLNATHPVALDFDCLNPFFSPDGAWVGCFNARSGLVKVPILGGTPVPLALITERIAGAAWASDGSILFATSEGLFRVADAGGTPERIAQPDFARGERQFAWPELLPTERALLLTVQPLDPDIPPRIVRLDLESLRIKDVLKGGGSPHYVPGGLLVYESNGRLLGVRFDAKTGAIRGESRPVPDLDIDVSRDNSAANFAISTNGTLVTLRRETGGSGERVLYWRDANGVETPLDLPAGNYVYARISPNGRRVALDIRGNDSRDIWIFDLVRGSQSRMTTDAAEDNLPIWSRDGRRVFFSSNRGGDFDIYSQAPDGSDVARKEVSAPRPQLMLDISPDGRRILAVEDFRRLVMFEKDTDSLKPLLNDGSVYWAASISPDSNWIAYESNESGDDIEIFVRPFPAVTAQRQKISLSGGRWPVWGPAGSHALYYVQPDGVMMRAELRFVPNLQVDSVTRLFEWSPWHPILPRISGTPYDVSPLDSRFLLSRPAAAAQPTLLQVDVVLNWFDELRRLVPE